MTSTVVVCAYTLERWDALVRAVKSCNDQTAPPDQVVVVVDHNDDLLARATTELEGALVVANRYGKGLSGARNTGIVHSSGDIVAFLDDDAYADPGWLAALLAPFKDDDVAGVGGWIVPEWTTDVATWFPRTYYWILGCSYDGLPASGATVRNPIGASMALRRSVFDAVGGFTHGIGRIGKVPLGCEETELCIRYTARRPDQRFVLTHDAVVHHLVPASRLRWHYFWTRCWAEGLSKAAVSSLVGARSGLASEREHLLRAMPKEILAALASVPRHPRLGMTRATLIVVGAMVAAAGLARGRLALARHPLEGGGELDDLRVAKGDVDGPWPSAAQPAG